MSIVVFRVVTPRALVSSALKIKAVCSMFVTTHKSTRRHNLEDRCRSCMVMYKEKYILLPLSLVNGVTEPCGKMVLNEGKGQDCRQVMF
jgi:hypothetical protein